MAWLTVFNGSGHIFRIEGGGGKVWIWGRGSIRDGGIRVSKGPDR